MKNLFSKYLVYTIILYMTLLLNSCSKFVTIDPPPTALVGSTVFTSDASARSAMAGVYSSFMQIGTLNGSMSMWVGLSSDELADHSTVSYQGEFYSNSLTPLNNFVKAIWSGYYQIIYSTNAVLEGLSSTTDVTKTVKDELNGEAKFMRAYCYFYLVNLFGDVPLVLSTDYQLNKSLVRSNITDIYKQIQSDLTDARNLLSDNYAFSNGEKTLPSTWSARAYLAKLDLYLGNWQDAETEASEIINSGQFNLLNNLDSVFLANNDEAIWQMAPVEPGFNTWDATNFILESEPTTVAISQPLLNSFENGDARKIHWIDSISVAGITYYFAYKYKIKASMTVTEYLNLFRLAEIYLIRSEARIEQGDLTGALSDLNTIRSRSNLQNFNTFDKTSLLNAIAHEKQVELFTENGNRWLDLKRTDKADAVLGPIKTEWQSTDTLYPIPQTEIQNDPNLAQNPGY